MYFLFVVVWLSVPMQSIEKTRLRNDLLTVEWDVKPHTLTHSLFLSYVIKYMKIKQVQSTGNNPQNEQKYTVFDYRIKNS